MTTNTIATPENLEIFETSVELIKSFDNSMLHTEAAGNEKTADRLARFLVNLVENQMSAGTLNNREMSNVEYEARSIFVEYVKETRPGAFN